LKRRAEKYQVLRTHIEVEKPGIHKMRLEGDLSQMNLFLGKVQIELPAKGQVADLLIDCKTAGRQHLLLVRQGTSSSGQFSLEARSEDMNMVNTF
jgi:hypothetical protein